MADKPVCFGLACWCRNVTTSGAQYGIWELQSQNIFKSYSYSLFDQTRVCDCWNSGKTSKDGFGDFCVVTVAFELSMFYGR